MPQLAEVVSAQQSFQLRSVPKTVPTPVAVSNGADSHGLVCYQAAGREDDPDRRKPHTVKGGVDVVTLVLWLSYLFSGLLVDISFTDMLLS